MGAVGRAKWVGWVCVGGGWVWVSRWGFSGAQKSGRFYVTGLKDKVKRWMGRGNGLGIEISRVVGAGVGGRCMMVISDINFVDC